jgi:hypothetical protein
MKVPYDSSKILKIRGMLYMFIATIASAALNIGQKFILAQTAEQNNPIHAFEFTYVSMMYLLILYLLTLKFTDLEFYPLP